MKFLIINLHIITLSVLLLSCAGTGTSNSNLTATAKDSPSNVVIEFIDATMKNDFSRAYNYIYFPGTDKEGYVSRMQDLVETSQNKIKSYKLISTRIIGDKSYVVYELELLLGGKGASNQNLRYTRNQLELTIINNHWKIIKDYGCIENCVNE